MTVEVQEPTLAFVVGGEWSLFSAPLEKCIAISYAWRALVIQYAATPMPDMNTLLQLVQCKRSDLAPAPVAQHTMTASALGPALAARQHLVFLIHALGTVAGNHAVAGSSAMQHDPELPGTASPSDFMKLDVVMKALQVFGENPEPESIFDIDLNQQDVVPVLMRSVILFLKVTDLTPQSPTIQDASVLLWCAIEALAKSLKDHTDSCTASGYQPTQDSSTQQQQLGLILVQLILHIVRYDQGMWEADRLAKVDRCFQLLTCLVNWPYTQSSALVALRTKAGMALIAKGLVQAKVTATLASHLLGGIFRAPEPTLQREAMLRLLAEMQGVRCLSNLLCPTVDPGDEQLASGVYKTKSVQIKDASDGPDDSQTQTLELLATLMGGLLYAHPYSLQSPVLEACYQAQFDQDSTSHPSDTSPSFDNPPLLPSSSAITEQQPGNQAGQQDAAAISTGACDQPSSSALGDLKPLGASGQVTDTAAVRHSHQSSSSLGSNTADPPSPREVAEAPCADASDLQAAVVPLPDDGDCWETPSDSVWADTETVALRALVTLQWATQGKDDELPEKADLVEVVIQLLHGLLVGHVMDPKLDMARLLKVGQKPLFSALRDAVCPSDVVTETCLRQLTHLFLRRLTTDRRAFAASYGDRAHELSEGVVELQKYPAVLPLWHLLYECVARVESTARPSLLQDYIEAAYLLTDTPEPRDMIEEVSHTGFTPNKEHVGGLTMKYEATGTLRLFHDAMLAPHPLHTRLTSCACLLKIWATELADEMVQGTNDLRAWPFQTWVSQSGLVSSICDCLQAGLEAAVTRPTEGQEVCLQATEQRFGLARALYEARAALSCLFQGQPQQTLALVQLVVELVRSSNQCSSQHEVQEQILRVSVTFLQAAHELHPDSTQSFSNVTDVVAEVLPHWERPWQTISTPFHSAHGYIGDYLPDCEPEKVLPDLVTHVVQRESGTPEWQSMQTVIISTMHWLQSAGAAGLGSILSDVPLSFRYDALIQSLGLIPSCMNLEKSAGEVQLRSWSDGLPSCTSRALLQLLSVHVMQLTHAFKELAPATHALQWQTLVARKAGSPALGSYAKEMKNASAHVQNAIDAASNKIITAKTIIGCILDKLTDIQDHPVWGKALAGVQKSGWCSDHKILAAVHLGRVSVESRLGEKQMQQLQSALLRPMPQRSLEAVAHAQCSLDAREAAANEAAQQLLAEEDQDAAKAAAKKAKKLRQKLKKQQQAQGNQPTVEPQDATAKRLGSRNEIVRWQDASSAINDDPADLEPSMQSSDAQEHGPESSESAILHLLSQASVADGQGANHPPVQSSGFANSAAGASFSLFSPAQSSRCQEVIQLGAAGGGPGSLYKLLCCPLTKVMMVDPVIAADGHNYERAAFQDWLHHSAMSPVDRKPLKHTRLVTNLAIKNALAVHWQQA